MTILRAAPAILLLAAGCGTTYEVAEITPTMMAATSDRHAAAAREGAPERDAGEGVSMFERVRDRIEPVAEAFCRDETKPGTPCDVKFVLDPGRDEVNAYQTYVEGVPTLIFTPAFLDAVGDDDELAYVMGHEVGHHVAGHLDKRQTQQAVGALGGALLGGLAVVALAAAGAQPSNSDIDMLLSGGLIVGGAAGGTAYSQTYELESDMIGAYIAEAAGYDPEAGSVVFPRLAGGDHPAPKDGQAAFWSTHPSSPERLAWAAVVAERIRADRTAGLRPRPPKAKALEDQIADTLSEAFSLPE